ncbi:MAG: GNAT family N-acetyltransferase [Nitrososphaeria archaeon]
MLVYRDYIVQLRGVNEAVKELLKYLDIKEVELQAQLEHETEILKEYKPNVMHKIILMHMRRGEEKFQARYPVRELGLEEAEDIANLMRDSNPEFWGDVSAQQIADGIRRGLNWIGIKVDGKLVSIGSVNLTGWAGLIGTVATHVSYRNRGYATTIISELMRRIIEKNLDAIIFVLEENLPAIKVYEKNGFNPYRKYFFIRGSRI